MLTPGETRDQVANSLNEAGVSEVSEMSEVRARSRSRERAREHATGGAEAWLDVLTRGRG
jgi:hypothetical protein